MKAFNDGVEDKRGTTFILISLEGLCHVSTTVRVSFMYIAIPDPSDSKEPCFDTTNEHGSSWREYRLWKLKLSEGDLNNVASYGEHIKNDVKNRFKNTKKILVFLLLPGQ